MSSKDIYALLPGTWEHVVFYDTKDFADVIKIEMGEIILDFLDGPSVGYSEGGRQMSRSG